MANIAPILNQMGMSLRNRKLSVRITPSDDNLMLVTNPSPSLTSLQRTHECVPTCRLFGGSTVYAFSLKIFFKFLYFTRIFLRITSFFCFFAFF